MPRSTYLLIIALFGLLSFSRAATISPTSGQTDTTEVTNTDAELQENTCFCDVNSGFCNDQCCCDSDCTDSIIRTWKIKDRCINRVYTKSPSKIPKCTETLPVSLADLHLGLRIFYHIVRNLFCVQVENQDVTARYQDYKSESELDKAALIASNTESISSFKYNIFRSGTNEKFRIPREGFGSSECSNIPAQMFENMERQTCLRQATDLATFCAAGTWADPQEYSNLQLRANDGDLTVTFQKQNTWFNDVTSIGNTLDNTYTFAAPDATLAGTCTCENFVSEVNYRIVIDEDLVITDAEYDIVLISSQEFDCAGTVYVPFTTSVFYTSTDDVEYPSLKGPGYRFGDPIRFGKLVENTNPEVSAIEAFIEPLNFNFLGSSGRCASQDDEIDQAHNDYIQFGYNHQITCSFSTNLEDFSADYCPNENDDFFSNIWNFKNVASNIEYVAKWANSNPLYIQDWYEISSNFASDGTSVRYNSVSNTCTFSMPRITIYYSAIGKQLNPEYRINSVQIQEQSETLTYNKVDTSETQDFEIRMNINFVQLPQDLEFYVAPIPDINVVMADNILYPFDLNN